MIKEISINKNNVILNFSNKYCSNTDELLNSKSLNRVLSSYIKTLKKSDSILLDSLYELTSEETLETVLVDLFKLLSILDIDTIISTSSSYETLLKDKSHVIEFVEGLYNYWRSLERYALIESSNHLSGIENTSFVNASSHFSNLVLKTYRTIEEKLQGTSNNIYRQLNAGVNAGIILNQANISLPNEYLKLNDIKTIKEVVLTPPLIIYPKVNKRSGFFTEVFENPLNDASLNSSHYFCYPAKVGRSLAFIYFHRNFMSQGISLCNLFELAVPSEYTNKSPDLIYIFGGKKTSKTENETSFYIDKKNSIYVGYASNDDQYDYFGYMKKMVLTLHNLRMIDRGCLPIHGAMVNITLKNGIKKNIAIIGDSGAGKSESLEAFRTLSKKYLKEIKIIFDDMGTFEIINNEVNGYGTEVGAFVRLDDLELGYSFNQMDRAIFMNPHKENARLLIPISTYETVVKPYKLDLVLYANNYENDKKSLDFFDNYQDALDVFVSGKRKAKGTTSESGIVSSYFANPFGPHQRQEQTNIILDVMFKKLFENNIPVGQIYTKLAIEGYEQKGPQKASKVLFEWLKKQ